MREWIFEDGNVYDYGFRWLDPSVGRWMSADPLAEWAPQLTPYRYGFNNPLLYTDPYGLFESKKEARKYAKENGIKTGLFRKNKIRKNKKSGEYQIKLNGGDGTIAKNSDSGEVEYFASAQFTGDQVSAAPGPNMAERVRDSGLLGGAAYGILDDAWVLTQTFNPFDVHVQHLSGNYAAPDAAQNALVNTTATFVPAGRAVGAVNKVAPKGITLLSKLNAAQFSKTFKGTIIARAHPSIRGRLNRLLNGGIQNLNTRVQTGNILFQGTKALGNSENDE